MSSIETVILACKDYEKYIEGPIEDVMYWMLCDDLRLRQHLVKVSIPLVYTLEDVNYNTFELDLRYEEDRVVQEMFDGIKNGIVFEILTDYKWKPPWERPSRPSHTRQHKN